MSNNEKDSLGDRMKGYEDVYRTLIPRKKAVIIRVDGKAFHTLTRQLEKPFDETFIKDMFLAAKKTAKIIQGFKLAYVQSDEVSFLLNDLDTPETEAWFGYNVNKMVSITAATMSVNFAMLRNEPLGIFDARVFEIPVNDIPNYFLWRAKDWRRNSIQMLARSLYSQNQLHKKKVEDLLVMCKEKGKDWNELDVFLKYGTFFSKSYLFAEEPNYKNMAYIYKEAIEDNDGVHVDLSIN